GRNVAYYHMYQSALRHRSLEEAMQYLSFIEEDGISDLAARAQELLDLAKVRGAGEAKKIGIMLPLTGDLRPFAEEVLQGIQVAARLAYSEGIEFVVVDSGTT